MRGYLRLLCGGALALACVCFDARAQTARQDIEARERVDPAARPAALANPEIQFTSQRAPANAGEIVFQLNDIVVAGATAFDAAELGEIYAADIGAEIALSRIFEIAADIQALYRDADYIFTRVVVPAQEINGGVVRIEVIEALITAVTIEEPEGEIGPVRALAERMIAPLVGVANPTGAALERALLNVNGIPGVIRATAVPQPDPDDERGGLQLFVNVEREAIEGVIYADNRQTEGIGRGLVGGTVTFNSYSEAGDTTSLSVFNSFDVQSDRTGTGLSDGPGDFDERNTVQIAHQRNIGADGATLRAVALYSRTKPGDELADVAIDGEQIFAALEAEYPLIRARRFELGAAVGAEFFESETDISNGAIRVADDRLRVVRASLDGVLRDSFGYTRFGATLRRGIEIFDASDLADNEKSRDDADGGFTLVKAEVDRLVAINESLSFFGRISAQYAFDPLLASEEFAVGGVTFGRGVDPSLHTGDHGVGASGELRYLQPVTVEGYPVNLEFYGFADYGIVWNKGAGQPDRAQILTLGGGLRLFLPEDFTFGFEVGVPVYEDVKSTSTPDDVDIGDPRFYVNFSKRF